MADAINAIRTMQAKDVISARLATAYVTIDGQRFLLFQAKKIEAKAKKKKTEVPILGRTSSGHKTTGIEYTGTLTIYDNTSRFTEMMSSYKNTGKDLYFDLQITNNDPSSAAGAETKILKDCNIDEITIASFDAAGDWLEKEIPFTYEDFSLPETYKDLDGMV